MLFVEFDDCPGDAETQSAGLTRRATAVDAGVDVVRLAELNDRQRLDRVLSVRSRREVLVEPDLYIAR